MSVSALGAREGLLPPRRLVLGLSGKLVELGAQAAMLVVLPGVLGLADFGRFALVLTLVALGGTAASLGGPALAARLVAGATPERRAGTLTALGRRMAAGRAALVGCAAVLAAVAAAAWPERIDAGLAALVVVVLALDVAATLVAQLALAAGRTAPWSLRYAAQNVLVVALVPIGYALEGLPGAVAALAAAALGSLAFGVAVLARAAPRPARGSTQAAVEGTSQLAFRAGLSGLLQQLTFRGGVLAVALAHTHAETGRAAIAIGVALAGLYAVGQLFAVALPGHARAAAEDPRRAEASCARLAAAALPVVAAGVVAGAALAALTDAWGAGTALATAIAVVAFAPLLSAAAQAATVTLCVDVRLRATAAGAVVYALTAPWLVAWEGALGASLALLAAVAGTLVAYRRALPAVVGGRAATITIGASAAAVALALL